MEINSKFVLLGVFLTSLICAFFLGILSGVHFGNSRSAEDSQLAINVFDQKNNGIIQQSCDCEMVNKFSSFYKGNKHPLKFDEFGELQFNLKFRGFNEEDFVCIVFTSETSSYDDDATLKVVIDIYRNEIIVYNSTWNATNSVLGQNNNNHYYTELKPQVKDWRSFLIKFNSYDTSFQVVEAPTGQILFESIVPRNITSINSYHLLSLISDVQMAKNCSYFNAHGQVFNTESHIVRQVKTRRDDEIIEAEEFICKQK